MNAPVVLRLDLPHGHLVAVAVPEDVAPLAAALHAEERQFLATLAPPRQRSFAAGRVALRTALADLGLPAGPILPDARGAPRLPAGALGSISHKRALAVALAAPADPATGHRLGVDLEEDRPGHVDISGRVLTPQEREAVAAYPEPERGRRVLVRFSAKEAFYKAVNAFVPRYVSFQEVQVGDPDTQGRMLLGGPLLATAALAGDAGLYLPVPGHILTTARVWPSRH